MLDLSSVWADPALQQAALLMERSDVARALATSSWAYPLVSTVHLLGMGALLGSILTVDACLLGGGRGVFSTAALRWLRRTAALGLAVAMASGAALWTVRATDYLSNPWMWSKWGLLGAALLNILWFQIRRVPFDAAARGLHARVAGAVSLLCWLGVVLCGRWVAFA